MNRDKTNYRDELLAACGRLLTVEAGVSQMPKEQRDWFFGKEGHRDCFTVARALRDMLLPAVGERRGNTSTQDCGRVAIAKETNV